MSLPNFLCIGAPKSGTTSLFEILKQHSEIGLSSFKEPHFFDNDLNWDQGVNWYKRSYFLGLDKSVIGEFTPSYLSKNVCPLRIKQTLGDNVKFIVLLRNPVERAYSHYLHTLRDEHETLSFLEALKQEEERLKDFHNKKDDISYARFCYLNSGMYATHLKLYLDHFDKKQFCIILFDDFINTRKETINKILSFLNVSRDVNLELDILTNQASKARSVKLKKFMKKKSFLRKLLKFMIPSLEFRQRIRNKIHEKNNKASIKTSLTKQERDFCYHNYFENDINELEKMLNINLNTWKT